MFERNYITGLKVVNNLQKKFIQSLLIEII